MKLSDILQLLSQTAKDVGSSAPYICGGTPRDKVMGRPLVVEDIDITTGDQSIKTLAKEMAKRTAGPRTVFTEMNDGHSQLIVDNIKLDFSTNYIEPGIKNMLVKAGLKNPTPMKFELYSRDFTCNTLLMTIDLKKVVDPIGLGLKDIKAKVLRTCLPAKITLGSDHRRVVRVIYLATKLGFKVDDEIINWVKKNPVSITAHDSREYVTKKLNKSLDFNPKLTVKLIDDMGLWSYVPPSDRLIPYMAQDVRGL